MALTAVGIWTTSMANTRLCGTCGVVGCCHGQWYGPYCNRETAHVLPPLNRVVGRFEVWTSGAVVDVEHLYCFSPNHLPPSCERPLCMCIVRVCARAIWIVPGARSSRDTPCVRDAQNRSISGSWPIVSSHNPPLVSPWVRPAALPRNPAWARLSGPAQRVKGLRAGGLRPTPTSPTPSTLTFFWDHIGQLLSDQPP